MSESGMAVTLRARVGEPLADPVVRDTVEAAARAIAERTGVRIEDLRSDAASVTATIGVERGGEMAAIGFAAELRRVTNSWHEGKFGVTLWGEDPDQHDGLEE